MYQCEYTNNTDYGFDQKLCDHYEQISYVGVDDTDVLKKALSCSPANGRWVQIAVPKIMDIPEQKPSMEGIVSIHSAMDIVSQRVIKTPVVTGTTVPGDQISNAECTFLTGRKLIVEGILIQKVIYTSLAEDQALHSATFRIPFSTFIMVDKATPLSSEFKIYPYLEDVFGYMLSPRTIFSNNMLFIKATSRC